MKNKIKSHHLRKQATRQLVYLSTCLLLPTSCDDGNIYTEVQQHKEGRTVIMTGNISGADSWTDDYKLALAGFGDDEEYAEITKYISTDGPVSIRLSGIGSTVKEVRLCVIDRLRRHVITLASADIQHVSDSTTMDIGTVNASMYNTIQQKVFNMSCTNCHGAAETAAAGLFLTADRSYSAIVNRPSALLPDYNLVTPGNAQASVLHMVISTDTTLTWKYNHSKDITSDDVKAMIDSWIDGML